MREDRTSLPPVHSRVSLAMMTHSEHANLLGNVHGGEITKLADSTAGAVAHRHPDAEKRHRDRPGAGTMSQV